MNTRTTCVNLDISHFLLQQISRSVMGSLLGEEKTNWYHYERPSSANPEKKNQLVCILHQPTKQQSDPLL